MCVKCKKCSICASANKYGAEAPEHDCVVNWIGASGAMEAAVALEMASELLTKTNGKVYIEYLVSDDDSSMGSHLRHEKMVAN